MHPVSLGVETPGDGRPELWSIFLCAFCASFHFHYCLLTFVLYVIVLLFHSCCSHAQVFGQTLVATSIFLISILHGTVLPFFFAR